MRSRKNPIGSEYEGQAHDDDSEGRDQGGER